jgi:hypothetical protein
MDRTSVGRVAIRAQKAHSSKRSSIDQGQSRSGMTLAARNLHAMSDLPKLDDAALLPTPEVPHGSIDREFPDRCKNCGTTDPADDGGRCPNPKCKALRKGAQLAARGGPVNVAKRDQLRARFKQDYRPSTTLDEVRCQELADLTERLSTIKKGSSEYARVVATMASLDVALRESRAMQQQQQPSSIADLSHEALIARLETLLAAARANAPTVTPSETPAFRRFDSPSAPGAGLVPQTISHPPKSGTDNPSEPSSDDEDRPRTNPTTPTGVLVAEEVLRFSGSSVIGGSIPSPQRAQTPASDPASAPSEPPLDTVRASNAPRPGQPPGSPPRAAPTNLVVSHLETDESIQRKQREIRERLGWDTGVIGADGLWRYRE